jgi:uncharacterized protein YggE
MSIQVISSLLVVLLATVPTLLFGQGEPEEAQLVVVGHGKVLADPDQAAVELGVTKRAHTARTAQEQVNQTVQLIISALSDLKIEEKDIRTSRVQLHPVYNSGSRQNPATREIVAYEATYSLSIQVSDLNQVGTVIDLALEAGANQLRGVRYELREESQFRQQALEKAIQDASAKAEVLAKAAGVQIVRIIEILEGVSAARPIEQRNVRMMAMAAESMQADTAVLPGQLTVGAGVTLRFEVAPG